MILDERISGRLAGDSPDQAKSLRLRVFSFVFLFGAVIGLLVNYTRTAEYRAGARLEIVPAEKLPGDTPAPVIVQGVLDSPFLTEVQLLTARKALEEVARRIPRSGAADAVSVSIDDLQKMISLETVAGTQVVQLWALGETPALVAFVLNELVEIYRTQLKERFIDASTDALEQARREVETYKAAVLKQRNALETFRLEHGIVSKEREENEATARIRGLNAAINAAEEKAVGAQSKLDSLRAAVAAGKATTRAKDNPTLAALEQRLSQAREDLSQLERRYTAAYLVREPQAAALKTRIPELEEQIRRVREASHRANLADAEQEAAQTREALASLRRQLAGDRRSVQSFSARLGEYGTLQTQVDHLQKLHDAAVERVVRFDARDDARRPKLRIIEAASPPDAPWRPQYHRDALIVIGASLVLGWLAAWLADFLMGRQAGSPVVIMPAPVSYPIRIAEIDHQPTQSLRNAAAAPQLSAPVQLPRELEQAEIGAMFECADLDTQIALSALLCGVAPEEVAALTWNEVSGSSTCIRIMQPTPRTIEIAPEIHALWKDLQRRKSSAAGDFLIGAAEPAALTNSLESLVSYAAHDAALHQPAEVTPGAVRHTLISYLVRQGLRFSDLARIVGPLPADVTAMYGLLQPTGARRSLEPSERVMPALRQFAAGFENAPSQPSR